MTSTQDPIDFRSGTRLGNYSLVRPLDEGAMSRVWLAKHLALDVPVAVKILKGEGHTGDSLLEGRIAARLRHPAIVLVFDTGCAPSGHPFLVMEYLTGSSLAAVLKRDHRLPVLSAVRLLLPVLDALCFCHEQGVVHRDIKPANLFLARERGATHAKLLDFGVAKPLCTATSLPDLSGTPGYMAPEQVHGATETDCRADIWAFCAVLYEAVAGRPVIEANTWQAALVASVDPKIAPLGDSRTTASLWRVLEPGLRKLPEHRPCGEELRDSLVHWLTSTAGAEAERPPPARVGGYHAADSAARSRLLSRKPRDEWDGHGEAMGLMAC